MAMEPEKPVFQIEVTQPFFYVGRQIEGTAKAYLPFPLENNGVMIKLVGIMGSNISESDIRDDDAGKPHRVAYRDIVYPKLDPVLMKGVHLWPFTLSIPDGAPPSWSSPAHAFAISHHIQVVVKRRAMFARDYEGTLTVRVVQPPMTYALQPVRRVERLLEKTCWREGGLFSADFRILESSLVTGEVLTVMADIDLTGAKADISMIQLRLFQEVVLDGVNSGKWKGESPLAVSPLTTSTTNLKCRQRHSVAMVLRIPSALYTAPSIKSKRLQCAYRVMIFVSPEEGPDFSETFCMPLESIVERRMAIFSGAPSSSPMEALPPAYSPQPPAYQAVLAASQPILEAILDI